MQKRKTHSYIYMKPVVLREGIDQLHPELVIQQDHSESVPSGAGDVQTPAALLCNPQKFLSPLPLELAVLEQHLQPHCH